MPELLALTAAMLPLSVAAAIARTAPLLPPLNLTAPRNRSARRHTTKDHR